MTTTEIHDAICEHDLLEYFGYHSISMCAALEELDGSTRVRRTDGHEVSIYMYIAKTDFRR